MDPNRAVTGDSLGAWLLKADPGVTPPDGLAGNGFRDVASRCVRQSYRTAMIETGQPVLLWFSGRDRGTPAGIHAQGRILGRPEPAATEAPDSELRSRRRLEVPVELRPVDPPVLRAELLSDPVLARIEVLRMPAGSNPSYLTLEEVERLRLRWPQVELG